MGAPTEKRPQDDDGENEMKNEWTEQDLKGFAQTARAVFESVELTELQPDAPWQDDGMQVDYELRSGRVDCVLHRMLTADGKLWRMTMSAPLAGNVLPEERMTPRERELCREGMRHDCLSGVYNRRYLETVVAPRLAQWAKEGRMAAIALVQLDDSAQMLEQYGQQALDQLVCFVANQWKKQFDTPAERVVCRLADSVLAVGCVDVTGAQLQQQMQQLYAGMPHECIATTDVMQRVPYTLSIAAAGLDEPGCTNWAALHARCAEQLNHPKD